MAKLISKVYSDALFEATKALEKTDTVYEEVLDLKNIFKENEDFKKLLNSPKIVKEEKIQSVQAVFADKISKELMGLLTVVIE